MPRIDPRARRRAALAAVALLLSLAGCAGAAPDRPSPAARVQSELVQPELPPAAQRGRDFALRRCSGCHTVGLDDGGAGDGPAFRRLARSYNALSLSARFREVSAHGFDRMPPIGFSASETEDLVAYFETLDRP